MAVVAVAFGWGRMPEVGKAIGRSFLNFRRALNGTDEIDVTPRETLPEAGEEATKPDPRA